MAGAGTALTLEPSALASNPAGLLDTGNQVALGLGVFRPEIEYEVRGQSQPVDIDLGDLLNPNNPPVELNPFALEPGRFESGRRFFPVPHAAASRQLDEHWGLGIALYGNGAPLAYPDFENGNCDFQGLFLPSENRGTYCSGAAEFLLVQAFLAPSIAYRWENWQFGASLLLVGQVLEAKGLETFGPVSQDADNLSNNGLDESFGVGARFGFQGELLPGLRIGGAWSPQTSMSEFDDYRGLLPDNGRLNIPENWSLGLAWQPGAGVTLALDVQHIAYADVGALGNPLSNIQINRAGFLVPGMPRVDDGALGESDGPGLGYDDMTIYKFGLNWRAGPRWSLRAGYSHANAALGPEDVFQGLLGPATSEDHYTAGTSYRWSPALSLDLLLLYSPEESVTGPNPFADDQHITVRMRQSEFELGLRWTPGAGQ